MLADARNDERRDRHQAGDYEFLDGQPNSTHEMDTDRVNARGEAGRPKVEGGKRLELRIDRVDIDRPLLYSDQPVALLELWLRSTIQSVVFVGLGI